MGHKQIETDIRIFGSLQENLSYYKKADIAYYAMHSRRFRTRVSFKTNESTGQDSGNAILGYDICHGFHMHSRLVRKAVGFQG